MKLIELRQTIDRELESNRARLRFQVLKRELPELSPFETPRAVVRFLADNNPAMSGRRSLIACDIVEGVQGGSSSLLASLLIAAFFPVLIRIRCGLLRPEGGSAAQLDWLVVDAFFETVASFPVQTQGQCAVINLVLGTRKNVCALLRADAARVRVETSLSDRRRLRLADPSPSPEARLGETRRTRPFTRDALTALGIPDNHRELLCESSISYVRSRFIGADAQDFARIYARYRKRRSRALKRVNRLRDNAV